MSRFLAITFMLWIASRTVSEAATLELRFSPVQAGEDLQPASLRYRTSAAETFSVTRVSWLLCEVALQRQDGSWFELSNSVAWLDYEAGRNSARLPGVPTAEYRSLRFQVGLSEGLNHADPAKFAAGHPLNPNLNGLHWSWQGGYIFMALEGLWRRPDGQLDGWAYHLARDTNVVPVSVAVALEITQDTRVELDLDLGMALNAPCPLSFARDGSSTHSRDGDPIAARLRSNLAQAFSVRRVTTITPAERPASLPTPRYLPPAFRPYELQVSATFPIPDLPRDNPLLVERVELGKTLFADPRLSINDGQACASCHAPEHGFTDSRRTSTGAEGATGRRHAMTLFNLAWKREFFWDGRAKSLREQVLKPIQDPLEMHQPLTNLVSKLTRTSDYPPLFAAAFGTPEITAEKIALALENYLLTLTSQDAKFDRVGRGETVFSLEEQRGFALFSTEYDPRRGQYGADCFHCHGGPLFQSQNYANNGLDTEFTDQGRAEVTGLDSDRGKFSVPSLRNVAVRGTYMHDGRFATLEEVVQHYASGIKRSATLDPNLAKHPDGGVPLTKADQQALLAFLRTLTDRRFEPQQP